MSDALPTARPAAAAICWATRDAIFVEYPCKDGPPYIIRMPRTTEALVKALGILIENPEAAPRPAALAEHPKIVKATRTPWANDEQRAKTQEVLRRLKIVGG
jgi:hypothetical protein